jgi:hypothetical protein
MQSMVITMPVLSGYAVVRHLEISLPLIDQLIADQPGKYRLPDATPAVRPAAVRLDNDERNARRRLETLRQHRQKRRDRDSGREVMEGKPREPRAPSLRAMVRMAVRSQSAEEFGAKLKQRWDRQQRRQGIETGRERRASAELDEQLDRLLGG